MARYQIILKRQPFRFNPEAAPQNQVTPTAESFAKSLKLTMITEDNEKGIKIGFVDERTNKSYVLAPGESQDGIAMVEADYDQQEALLKQGDDMAVIKMATGQTQALTPADAEERMRSIREGNRPSFAERRRQRILEQQAKAVQSGR